MTNLHNKSTYQNIYNEFSSEFIDAYCSYKQSGLDTKDSLIGARNKMQLLLEIQLKDNVRESKLIMQAFKTVSNDSKLIEKAIMYYSRMK